MSYQYQHSDNCKKGKNKRDYQKEPLKKLQERIEMEAVMQYKKG